MSSPWSTMDAFDARRQGAALSTLEVAARPTPSRRAGLAGRQRAPTDGCRTVRDPRSWSSWWTSAAPGAPSCRASTTTGLPPVSRTQNSMRTGCPGSMADSPTRLFTLAPVDVCQLVLRTAKWRAAEPVRPDLQVTRVLRRRPDVREARQPPANCGRVVRSMNHVVHRGVGRELRHDVRSRTAAGQRSRPAGRRSAPRRPRNSRVRSGARPRCPPIRWSGRSPWRATGDLCRLDPGGCRRPWA